MTRILILILLSSSICFGQNSVVRHSKTSNLPDSMYVQGIIKNVTWGYCGIICSGGSLKVKLTTAIPKYSNKYVFIVSPCLKGKVKIGMKVNIIVSQLTENDKECYYQSVQDPINSNGFPFYKLTENERSNLK